MIRLRQSTATQEVPLGPFVDATDGFTAETALPIANTDIKVWKNGTTSLDSKNDAAGATHRAGGTYTTTLDATDTATTGPLTLSVSVAGARPVTVYCEVLAPALYDSIFGSVGIASNIVAVASDAASATKLGSLANTVATTVVGLTASTTTSVVVSTLLTTPVEIFTLANQMRGKILRFTSNASNSDGVTCAEARIVASTTPVANEVTLTVEPPLPAAPLVGDIAIIVDSELPGVTAAYHAKASVESLQGSVQAAQHLTRMGLASASGTLAAGSTTQVLNISAIMPAQVDANQLRGRVVLIVDESGSEAALKIQGGRISSNTTTALTLEQPLTRAPAAGNVFIIV